MVKFYARKQKMFILSFIAMLLTAIFGNNSLAQPSVIFRPFMNGFSNDPADDTSGKILLTIPQSFTNHRGGDLNFSSDGYLYSGTSGGDRDKVEAVAEAPLPVILLNFQAQSGTGEINLTWETSFEEKLKQFEVEFSENNIDFKVVGIVPALNTFNGEVYRFNHTVFNQRRVFYRLKIVDIDGSVEYSKTVMVDVSGMAKNYVFPTVGTNSTIGLYLTESFENVEILDMQGKLLRKQILSGRTGRIDIQLPPFATGNIVVRLNNVDPKKNFAKKVFVR